MKLQIDLDISHRHICSKFTAQSCLQRNLAYRLKSPDRRFRTFERESELGTLSSCHDEIVKSLRTSIITMHRRASKNRHHRKEGAGTLFVTPHKGGVTDALSAR